MEKPRWAGEALRERVGDIARPGALDECHDPVPDQVTHEVSAGVDVARELPVHWVVGHEDASGVVLPHQRGGDSYPNPRSMARR